MLVGFAYVVTAVSNPFEDDFVDLVFKIEHSGQFEMIGSGGDGKRNGGDMTADVTGMRSKSPLYVIRLAFLGTCLL